MRTASGARRWCVAVSACCILQATLTSCARRSPAPGIPGPPAATTAAQDPVRKLQQGIVDITRGDGVARGIWAVTVHSLDRDERLFELNSSALLVPASSAKIVTIATAAEAVGWDHRYVTTLQAMGPVSDGVLGGDLVIVGSGDPSIGGRGGEDLSTWIDELKAAGIRRINGRIIGDDDAIEEPRPQLAWAWDDLGYTSGAIFGALNLAENRMVATISPGSAAGLPTTLSVEPHAANRPLTNRTVTGAAGSQQLLWPEQRPGEPFLTVAGSIPAGAPPARVNVSVGNPTFWFASVFRSQLLRNGIEVTGDAFDIDDVYPPLDRSESRILYTHKSRPLAEIARPMLKDSINLYGEAFLRLNVADGVFPTNDAALEGLRLRLRSWGIPDAAYQLVDGSGLSRRDVISADALLRVLQRMHDSPAASPIVNALPVAGIDGSLSERMRGTAAEGVVRAKTGTMSNVRSLAGYARTRDGERIAFAIIVNNFEGAGASANGAIDSIASLIASFTRTGLDASVLRERSH